MDRKEADRGHRGVPHGWGLTKSGRVGREAQVAVCEVPEAKGGPGKAGPGWLRWVTCMRGHCGWTLDFRTRDSRAKVWGSNPGSDTD